MSAANAEVALSTVAAIADKTIFFIFSPFGLRTPIPWRPFAAGALAASPLHPCAAGRCAGQTRRPTTLKRLSRLQQGCAGIQGGIMSVTPYLFFDGRCEEAIEFYKKALGAEVGMMMRFNETPEPHPPGMCPPGSENKIMHASLRINGASIMASDGRAQGCPSVQRTKPTPSVCSRRSPTA